MQIRVLDRIKVGDYLQNSVTQVWYRVTSILSVSLDGCASGKVNWVDVHDRTSLAFEQYNDGSICVALWSGHLSMCKLYKPFEYKLLKTTEGVCNE